MSLFNDSPDRREKPKSLFDAQWNASGSEGSDELGSPVAVDAILALVFGLLSLLIFVDPLNFFFVALSPITLVLSLWSYWRIRRSNGALSGASLALAGLFFSLFVLLAVKIEMQITLDQTKRQGRQFGLLVLEQAKQGNALALSLMRIPHMNRPTIHDEVSYWNSQITNEDAHAALHSELLDHPTFLTLEALGDKAEISYLKTDIVMHSTNTGEDRVIMRFAVTYPNQEGKKESFLILLVAQRITDTGISSTGWSWQTVSKVPISKDLPPDSETKEKNSQQNPSKQIPSSADQQAT